MKSSNIKLFYKLLASSYKYKSAQYYASQLKVSTKTVYNYLNEFQDYRGNLKLSLSRKPNRGIRIIGERSEIIAFIESLNGSEINHDTLSRRKYILEKLLMLDQTISIRKLAEEFYISRSSITSDLKYIEKYLNDHEIKLLKGKKGTQLGGKEQRIRSAKRKYIISCLEKISENNNSFQLNDLRTILKRYISMEVINHTEEVIELIKKNLNFDIPIIYLTQLYTQLAITLDRYTKNVFLQSTTMRPVAYELHIMKTYPVSLKIASFIEKFLSISLNDHEKRYLNSRISGVYKETTSLKYNHPEEIHQLVLKLVNRVNGIFNDVLSKDAALIRSLQDHFVPLIIRLKNNNKISNPLINGIKDQYSAMFSLILLAVSSLESEIGYILSDDEISFIMIHFQSALERLNISKKIAIVSDADSTNLELIKSRIKNNIPTFDILETIPLDRAKLIYLGDFDLVISTADLDVFVHYTKISTLVTDSDIDKIRTAYNKQLSEEVFQPKKHIHAVTKPDSIFTNMNFKNREEVITFGCNYLEKNRYVTKKFEESVLQREKIATTSIGRGIAIPHGSNKEVLKNQIVIITLRNPVFWGGTMADKVFLLSINLSDSELTKKILKELYYLVKSSSQVNLIFSQKNSTKLHNSLLENLY